jgi:2-methylcitrate dehydratase PrpD
LTIDCSYQAYVARNGARGLGVLNRVQIAVLGVTVLAFGGAMEIACARRALDEDDEFGLPPRRPSGEGCLTLRNIEMRDG